MNVQSITAGDALAAIKTLIAEALGLDPNRVFLTPEEGLIQPVPPAGTIFAALIPNRLVMSPSPQHPQIFPADLEFDVCLYSRVALDRGFSGEILLTDPDRGLFPLGDKLLRKLAGNPLESAQGQKLRGPLQVLNAGTVHWAEGKGLVLCYVKQSYRAPLSYDVG